MFYECLISTCSRTKTCVKYSRAVCSSYVTCPFPLLFSYYSFLLFLCSFHVKGRYLSVPSPVSLKDLEVFKEGVIISSRGKGKTQNCVFLPILETK